MAKEPKSYRVPILRLKDMYKKATSQESEGGEAPVQGNDQKGVLGNILKKKKEEVNEEDIAAAVITPSPTAPPETAQQTGAPVAGQSIETPSQEAPQASPPDQGQVPVGFEAGQPQGAETQAPETLAQPAQTPETTPQNVEMQPPQVQQEVPPQELSVETSEVPQGASLQESIDAIAKQTTSPQETPAVPQEPATVPEQAPALEQVPVTAVPETPEPATPKGIDVPVTQTTDEPRATTIPQAQTEEAPQDTFSKDVPIHSASSPDLPIAQKTQDTQETVSTPTTARAGAPATPEEVQPGQTKDPLDGVVDGAAEDFGSSPSSSAPLDIWERAEKKAGKTEEPKPEQKKPNIAPAEPLGSTGSPLTSLEPIGGVGTGVPKEEEVKPSGGVSNLSALRQKVLDGNSEPGGAQTTTEEKRPRPASKHAKVLADVADKLGDMSGKAGLEVPTSEKQIQGVTTPGAEGGEIPEGSLEEKKKEELPKSNVPLVRTFKGDVEQAIMKNQTSVVDMVTAQQQKQQQPSTLGETVRHAPKVQVSMFSIILMWVSAGLVLIGMAMGTFFMFRYITSERNYDTSEIVDPNESATHDITGQSRTEILEGLLRVRESYQLPLGSIARLKIVERTSDGEGASTKTVTTTEFFEKLNTRAPGILIRATEDDMNIGLHNLGTVNDVFWTFKVDSRQAAVTGMREWASDMRRDLSPLFGTAKTVIETEDGDSDESGSQRISFVEDVYRDVTVENTPARGLMGEDGEYALLWAIPNDSTVIITTNIDTLAELIERMQRRAD